jgi:hypothetical protein
MRGIEQTEALMVHADRVIMGNIQEALANIGDFSQGARPLRQGRGYD